MKIKVTQTDIDNGTRESYSNCPIALAIARHAIESPLKFPFTVLGVIVENNKIKLSGFRQTYSLPMAEHSIEREFIGDFDDGFTMKPFEFEMDLDNAY